MFLEPEEVCLLVVSTVQALVERDVEDPFKVKASETLFLEVSFFGGGLLWRFLLVDSARRKP